MLQIAIGVNELDNEGCGLIVIGKSEETEPNPQELLPETLKFPEISLGPNETEIVFVAVVAEVPFGKVQI